jgi:hypothetical protein
MVAWIRKLFGLCNHQWDIHQKTRLHVDGIKLAVGEEFILQCRHCGNLKQKIFRS